jgi:predicted glycosyltransferase
VLGLRDILDDPAVIRDEWERAATDAVVQDYYDEVWIYGDQAVHDSIHEYGFSPRMAAKTRYVGYLDQRPRLSLPAPDSARGEERLADGPIGLCLVGGGQDGVSVAETFAQADLPAEMTGVVVTGPYMPPASRQRLSALATGRQRLRVLDFVPEPTRLIERAGRVVTMGGYNSICEALSFAKRTLVIPRVTPRREQIIRAERLQQLGVIDMVHPSEMTPEVFSRWLRQTDWAAMGRPNPRQLIDFNGLRRIPTLVKKLLQPTAFARHTSPVLRGPHHVAS